ncbi:MAG TPA: hypothetical protein VN631_02370 [Negativicutes bacterium]|nr:hypothetical protein [Negativicutes bacterium]
MTKTRKTFLISMIVLLFLCTGCFPRSPLNNDLDTRSFYANMKPALANYGKKSAVYDNRIYFLSAENGTQGVYSMLFDGTDVQLEFETADIRSLTVTTDGFYYSGFSHVGVNDNGDYRCFHLYQRLNAQSKPIDLMSQAKNAELLEDDNVWDFYLKENGTLYFRIARMDFYLGNINLSLSTLRNGVILTMPDYSVLLDNLSAFDNPLLQGGLVVYQYEDQLLPVSNYTSTDADWAIIYDDQNVSMFDKTKQRTILPIDALFLSKTERYNGPYSNRWLLRSSDKKVLLAFEAGLYEYSKDLGTGKEVCAFPKTESIFATYDNGSDIFLMTKTFRKEGWIRNKFRKVFRIPDQRGENLYRFNPSTGASLKMLLLDEGEEFLYIDETSVATASDNTISIYDISGDTAILQRTIEIGHNVVDLANKADTAGGWLFLYRFNEKTQRDELIEKVYIGA